MRVNELIKAAEKRMLEIGNYDAAFDAKSLFCHVLNLEFKDIYGMLFDEVSSENETAFISLVEKRCEGYPLQYMTHKAPFMNWNFYVDENVLIPRFDSEVLVLKALDISEKVFVKKSLDVLDMCTGSGCLGISFKLMREKEGYSDRVTLADISKGAVKVAEHNCKMLSADCEIVETDLFDKLKDRKFDIIISNPPYIKSDVIKSLSPEVKDHEPLLALDGKEDGLFFYRRIIDGAREHLKDGGRIIFEIGYDQFSEVKELLLDASFEDVEKKRDLADQDRVVSAIYRKMQ